MAKGGGTSGIARIAGFLAFAALASAQITLTDSRGQTATVEITRATPTNIEYRIDGRSGHIRMSDLSESSKSAAIDYAKSKGVFDAFPALTLQVKVVNQRRNDDEIWYKKTSKLSSSVVITGVSQMTPIPAAEAQIVILTQDTKKKYVDHVEKLKVWLADKIEIPKSEDGRRREFSFKSTELSFDTARDYTNAGGNEYKYYIFGLRDPGTGKLIHFESNDPRIQRHVTEHPEARDALLALHAGDPFSPEF